MGSSWLQHRKCIRIRIISFQVSPQNGGRNEERNQSPVMWSVSPEPWWWTRFDPGKKRSQKTSNRPQTRGWANKVFVDHIPDTKWAEESRNAPCSAVHELYWLLLMLCASSTARLLLARARARACVCVWAALFTSTWKFQHEKIRFSVLTIPLQNKEEHYHSHIA